ncbi:YgaP family membrane protein [Corynebacterium glutamicum]|uniref:YgaP family membrane protein n=1 Tax=Corynebacterium glutamicum TaxID=1718 RepID=UPI000943764E|nr:hypothetical protein AUO95_08200 [Corynebacterium glutamicum]
MMCNSGDCQRFARGVTAMFVAIFAINMLAEMPVVGIIAGLIALAMATSAITGVCPVKRPRAKYKTSDMKAPSFPDARGVVTIRNRKGD